MHRRLPFHVVLSFCVVLALGLDIALRCVMGHGHVGRFVTASAACGLALGAAAGLLRHTWGVGLMLASACSFFVAGALGMGPPLFFVITAVGALPFVLTVKHMARFDIGATILFAIAAGAIGLSASLSWNMLAPFVISMFAH